jgi:hypothetical protein
MNQYQYDSTRPLALCEFKHCQRAIGVTVSRPFEHHGFTPPKQCVEVSCETVTVNTATYAALGVPADNWKPEAASQTRKAISELDKTIAELSEHRDRLNEELIQL